MFPLSDNPSAWIGGALFALIVLALLPKPYNYRAGAWTMLWCVGSPTIEPYALDFVLMVWSWTMTEFLYDELTKLLTTQPKK